MGFKLSQSLKTLIIEDIKMDITVQDVLAEGIYSNSSIEALQFNNCAMDDRFGITIKKIISKRSEKINEAVWLKGLRGDIDESNPIKGLSSLVLTNCALTDNFVSSIISALSFDQCIRVLTLPVIRLFTQPNTRKWHQGNR